jgi:DNA mismatch repair protein MutL
VIRVLPEEVLREIAAGEVVFSVADAVRELLENSLDAGATRVQVALWGGGLERLLVRDNGQGIPKEELPLAVERHTTSKLERLDRIQTLGFRGEGLYALRQAGRLRLTSRPREQLGAATVEAFLDEVRFYAHPGPPGTEAELKGLFLHLPARRRGLSTKEEERKVLLLLFRYLLHHPHLALGVRADGEERFVYPGGGFLEAAKAVWGPVVANRLLKVEHREGPYALEGLLSRPELARPRRDRLFLAVNGRPAEWPEGLLKAVLSAYRELLPKNSFPVGVLNLTLPPEEVLVHTAPEKARLRLLKDLSPFVEEGVRRALTSVPLARALPERSFGLFPVQGSGGFRLRYLGQFREAYLLAEGEGTLFIVDQHAAHERVLYEEILRRFKEEPPVELPAPEVVALSPEEEAHLEAASELGFVLEPFGPGRYLVRRVPAFLLLMGKGFGLLLEEALKEVLRIPFTPLEALRRVAARMACLPAVKAGHPLAQAPAQALLDALLACETPWVCPHGRPTVLALSEEELVRRFGRRSVRMVRSSS